ncbi:phage protein Gp27 family protein [Phenylobacterium sp.]|uniref:phage protein Gp27 family protein n=1 Tax=Phenylobacterium sp. TaxID=1871053 RepID=UPI0035B40F7D
MAGKPSSIDRLPQEVRDAIAALRRNGRTIDEILDHLQRLDVEVSRSALGRHVKSLAEIGESMRRAETMARFIVDKFGEDADERVGRANMRILQGALLEILTEDRVDEDGNPITLTAGEAKELSLSLQRLVSAQRMDAERQLRLKAEARAEAVREAAKAVDTLGKRLGWSADTAQTVRAQILGVRTDQVSANVTPTGG